MIPQNTNPTTILIVVLVVALVMLCLGAAAFHWGNKQGYRDGRRDEQLVRQGRPSLRTLGAMWTEQGTHDWQTETRPQERVRGWRELEHDNE